MDQPPDDPGSSYVPEELEIMEFEDYQPDAYEETDQIVGGKEATGAGHQNDDSQEDVEDSDVAEDGFETPEPALTIGEVLSRLPKKKAGEL